MKRRKPGSEAASRERASGDAGGSLQEISLPKSTKGRGTSVFAALKARRTTRAMSGKKLSQQVLSNLLWAACGVNRKKGPFGIPGMGTAGSASNSQEIDIYVLMEEGAYLLDAVPHCLVHQTPSVPSLRKLRIFANVNRAARIGCKLAADL